MVSTLALVVGLIIINVVQPGVGMNIDAKSLDTKGIAAYTGPGKMQSTTEFLLAVIPSVVLHSYGNFNDFYRTNGLLRTGVEIQSASCPRDCFVGRRARGA